MQIQVNHMDLAYEQAGSGPPLLLLHGNGEDHHIFDELSQKLQAQFTVYALDSRAHGQSSGNPADLSYELMARDVSAFIYQLQLAPVYLAGFSDGAILGLLLALRHPDCLRRLVLMGVNLKPADFTAENLAALQADYAQSGDPLLRLMLREPDLSLSQVQQITVPTLVIAAEHDLFKPESFRQLARALPDARLKIMPGADHSSYVVHQTQLYPELLAFFTEGPAAAGLPPLGPPGCLDSNTAWEAWRPQLMSLLQDQLYGRLPQVQLKTDLKLLPEPYQSFGGQALSQDAVLRFRSGSLEYSLPFTAVRPAAQDTAPWFLYLAFTESPCDGPAEEILDAGYGFISLYYQDIIPDSPDIDEAGLGRLLPRLPDIGRGKLALWAFAANQVYRAVCRLPGHLGLNPDRAAICGHSRLGKAALWAGVTEPGYSLIIANDSGAGGAALFRGKRGESIADLARPDIHGWFCERFYQYAGQEDRLPFDQHQLLALAAPRRLYIAGATEDLWADPVAEYQSILAAAPVFSLYGVDDPQRTLPAQPHPEQPYHDGRVGYHLRRGTHYLSRHDWQQFIAYRERWQV